MAKNNDPILGASDTPVTTENWKAPYEDSWAKNYKTRMDTARKGIGTLGAALVSPVHSVAAGVESLAGFGGNVISAMRTPTAEGHSMDMVAGRTQDVADQLGTVVRPISNSAAVAVQAATGQPVIGNPPAAPAAPSVTPTPALDTQATTTAPPATAPTAQTDPVLGFASAPGGATMIGNPLNYERGTMQRLSAMERPASERPWQGMTSVDGVPISVNDWQDKIARDKALEKEYENNRTLDDHLTGLRSGNTTWSLPRAEQMAIAKENFAAQEKRNALQLGDTTTQRGQDMSLEGVKTTAKEAAESRKAVAEQAAQATVLAAREAALAKQSQNKDKQDESDKKDIHDILTNGYGVAPTPQAIQAYRAHQSSLVAWDNNTTKMLAAHTKANPKDGAVIKSSLLEYHRNPTSEEAIKGVEKARALLTGGGAGVEPDWFVQALKMPTLNTAGMQAWK